MTQLASYCLLKTGHRNSNQVATLHALLEKHYYGSQLLIATQLASFVDVDNLYMQLHTIQAGLHPKMLKATFSILYSLNISIHGFHEFMSNLKNFSIENFVLYSILFFAIHQILITKLLKAMNPKNLTHEKFRLYSTLAYHGFVIKPFFT